MAETLIEKLERQKREFETQRRREPLTVLSWVIRAIPMLLLNIPLMFLIGRVCRLIRMGFIFPLILIAAIFALNWLLDMFPTTTVTVTVEVAAYTITLFGMIAILGVILQCYRLPFAEAMTRQLAVLFPENVAKPIVPIQEVIIFLIAVGLNRGEDASAIMENIDELDQLQKIRHLFVESVRQQAEQLNADMATYRSKLVNEMLVRRLGEMFWTFISTVLGFALIYRTTNSLWPGTFDSQGTPGFGDWVYFSVMTVTTGAADLRAVTALGKTLTVIELLVGVGFLTIIIGASVSMFTGVSAEKLLAFSERDGKVIMKRLMPLLRDYYMGFRQSAAISERIVVLWLDIARRSEKIHNELVSGHAQWQPDLLKELVDKMSPSSEKTATVVETSTEGSSDISQTLEQPQDEPC